MTSQQLGSPFDIDGAFVEALGPRFTGFVNKLLQAERAAQGLSIDRLVIVEKENIPDGGVDATLRDSPGSTATPVGTSAWQFKRGDLQPAQAKKEYRNAVFAREVVGEAGSYCLVLGKDIPSDWVNRRVKALADEVGDPDRVRVMNASALADWANQYPSVLRHVGRVMGSFIPHESWSRSVTACLSLAARSNARGSVC